MSIGREVCPDCYRFKARNADDCLAGNCSKSYAVRDKEAEEDCLAFRNQTGYYARSTTKELEKLQTFFTEIAMLTLRHDRNNTSGIAYVKCDKLGEALEKVDPLWWEKARNA